MKRAVSFALVALGLSACADSPRTLADMTAVSGMDEASRRQMTEGGATAEYRISAQDLLNVTVFQVPDLSAPAIRVDSAGRIQLPLIGAVDVAGLTASEVATNVQARLAERYLRNPQVTVSVTEASSQKVTVDGAVTEAGVYEMKGRTTLMQAVAMAKGPTRTANLRSVAVFRNTNNQQTVALFDLAAIRAGQAQDPVLLGDDIVVVDTSRLNAALRDVLTALPAFAVFRSY